MPTLFLVFGCPGATAPTIIPSPSTAESDGDGDGDGWPASLDCDDSDPTVSPGAEEVWYDGVDQDCDGGDDFDRDGDGARPPVAGGGDCDDTDPDVLPLEGWESDTPCVCGNGLREAGEVCDAAGGSYTCEADCSGPCGDGIPGAEPCLIPVASTALGAVPIDVRDYDADGRIDLFFEDADTLWMRPGQSDGTFGAVVPVHTKGPLFSLYGVGDVDGNGWLDLVISEGFDPARVLLRGPGGVANAVDLGVGWGSAAVIEDFDGDGLADVAMIGAGEFQGAVVARQGPAGSFSSFEVPFAGYGSAPYLAHDLDLDGAADLLFEVSDGFEDTILHLTADTDGFVAVPVLQEDTISGMQSGDVDGDGCPDVFFWSEQGPMIVPCGAGLLPASSLQPFAALESFAGEARHLADLDGQGSNEILMYASGSDRILMGDGTGYVEYPLGIQIPYVIGTGDMDGDGRAELVQLTVVGVDVYRWDP